MSQFKQVKLTLFKKKLIERGFEIDTKLRLAKREFKTGLYIEEIFDERI